MDVPVVNLWNFTRRSEHLQSCFRALGTMNCPTAVAADLAISVCRNYEADQTDNFLSEYQCEAVDIWTFVLLEQVVA
jgi:hypothetical protein